MKKKIKAVVSWYSGIPRPRYLRFVLTPVYVPIFITIAAGELAQGLSRSLLDWLNDYSDKYEKGLKPSNTPGH